MLWKSSDDTRRCGGGIEINMETRGKSLGPTTDQGQLAQYMIEQYYGEGTKNSPKTV
jgi:hypothetical protein